MSRRTTTAPRPALPNSAVLKIKAAPAAPLARRQRQALPWKARPPHAGPHFARTQIKMAQTIPTTRRQGRSPRLPII